MPTNEPCDTCHTPKGWTPANFKHVNAAGKCSTCHNGATATGKPSGHVLTNSQCDVCHTESAWTPAQFDHSGVSGTCSSCHNGNTATGKPASHVPTTEQCDVCHSTKGWTPASFKHVNVSGKCSTCHNGSTATGKPGNHFVTTQDCAACHVTSGWSPVRSYRHVSGNYPDHGSRLDCKDCHTTNRETISWPFPAYAPDCAACHAKDWKSGPHKGATISQLRNCAGLCHKSRPQHSPRQRSWDD